MIRKSWLAGLVILVSLCLVGCTLGNAVRKAQPYIKEGNAHIRKFQKVWKEINQIYGDKLKTQREEADDLFTKLGQKEKPSEVSSLASQAKSKLEEIKETVADTQDKIAESKRELRLAKGKFGQAKKVGLSDWQAKYINLIINSLDSRAKALAKYEEMLDVVLELCDTQSLYADRIAAAKKKIYGDEFETTAEYKAYEKKYLTPLIDKQSEQLSKQEELEEEAGELASKADSLSQKADRLYEEKTK